MKKVHQYKLSSTATTIELPRARQVVFVGLHQGFVTIWIEHEADNPMYVMPTEFRLIATGDVIVDPEFGSPPKHVGSAQLANGRPMHVYEVP